jgi:hypothetical protein
MQVLLAGEGCQGRRQRAAGRTSKGVQRQSIKSSKAAKQQRSGARRQQHRTTPDANRCLSSNTAATKLVF